jgi:tetratricopeptide (TPR) repeat protein
LEAGADAVWTIGALRRGQLWETTAVPELRAQAEVIGRAVAAVLPGPRLRRRPRDAYGLPLSTTPAAAAAYDAALGRVLRVQSGAEGLVAEALAADDGFALGHAVRALLGAEWAVDGIDVEASLASAERSAATADARERRFIEVAADRVRRPGPAANAALIAYLQSYPEDALAVSLAVPTIAFGGATEVPAEAWALVQGLAPAYGADWWYRGLLAFVRQDQGRFEEARELAERSLADEPAAGHAVHAAAHVHYEMGEHAVGLAWLDRWISSCGATASHRAHFSWHAALHELSLGDDAAVRRRFAAQLSPADVTGVRALVDSASLLWRGHVAGVWPASDLVPDLTPVLATVPESLLLDPPTPFVAMHAAVALAAAGDRRRLAWLRRAVDGRTEPVFVDTVTPLAYAVELLAHQDFDGAAERLGALRGVDLLGGSAAQRELIEETLLYSLVAAGRYDQAAAVLDRRLGRRPSPRDRQRREHITRTARNERAGSSPAQ